MGTRFEITNVRQSKPLITGVLQVVFNIILIAMLRSMMEQ